MSSNDGFSVVAPTRVTTPCSTNGRKPSCWARLKRWISSTKSSVAWPASAAHARRLERLLEVGDAGEHRRELLELVARLAWPAAGRWWSCRCPAGPRGSSRPADGPRAIRRIGPSGPSRWSWPSTSSRLARTQAVGQRRRRLGRQARGFEEIAHRARVSTGKKHRHGRDEWLCPSLKLRS